MKTVSLKKNKDDHYIDLIDLEDIIDTSKVKKYEIIATTSGGMIIKFYDKNNKPLKTGPELLSKSKTKSLLKCSDEFLEESALNKSLKSVLKDNKLFFIKTEIERMILSRKKAKKAISKMDEDGFGLD